MTTVKSVKAIKAKIPSSTAALAVAPDSVTPSALADSLGHYDAIHAAFGWQVPEVFNMADVCSRRWADAPDAAQRIAVVQETGLIDPVATAPTMSYATLQARANQLSNVLLALGVVPGDRVGVVMPQRFETAIAYMAILQMGAVAMPLSVLFGPDALYYRLSDSEAKVAIVDEQSVDALMGIKADCPLLDAVIGLGDAGTKADLDFDKVLAQEPTTFALMETKKNAPAVLIYTSGTTGNPKGAMIPHQALIGNLTGFVCSQNWFGFDGVSNQTSDAVFWSPADWAWTGGLMDALLPTLYFGRPIIAFNGRFSPEAAYSLLAKHKVTHTFLFPTALKAMMKAYPTPKAHFDLQLAAIMSAGEAVGDAVFNYCQTQLGVTVNEMFGQTEVNYIVGNCAMNGDFKNGLGWKAKPGSMGKGYPGHNVAVIDEQGHVCAVGEVGDVALNRFDRHGDPDPIFFLGYWKNDAATHNKYTGDWCRTGDLAFADEQGYLWYQGRADDVFKAAGYRIGPSEIENCLVKHPAVANAAVVPKPDADRGAVVKAYVVLAPGHEAQEGDSEDAKAHYYAKVQKQLQAHVKGLLAPYEYPKEIEFVASLPMTTTGKVQRRILRLQEVARAQAAANAA
jgi:acetyl-CoA synthetase